MSTLPYKENITRVIYCRDLEKFVLEHYGIVFEFVKTQSSPGVCVVYQAFPLFTEQHLSSAKVTDELRSTKVVPARGVWAILSMLIRDGEIPLGNYVVHLYG